MKKYVHKVPCHTTTALVQRITNFLNNLTVTQCNNYVKHFKTVLNEIILRKGDWTDM